VTVSGAQRDLDAVHAGLVRWLRASRPDADGVRVGPLRRPSAGYSSETLLVDVVWTESGAERAEAMVARLPPAGGGIFPNYDLTRQARVQAALTTTAIPVAAPIAVELDETWIGAPFFLMRAVTGTVIPESYLIDGPLPNAAPDAQRRVQQDFVHLLADLHRLDWEGLGLGGLTPAAERGLAHDVTRARDYAAWAADGDVPSVLVDALDWCAEHRPDPEPPPALLWGDARIGNIVYGTVAHGATAGELAPRAVLDWEMASIGPAETDLAWFLSLHDLAVERNRADLPGFAPHDDVIAEYAARLGRDVRDYRWFEVFGLVRSDSIFLRIRRMLAAAGLDEPWLRGPSPGQQRIDELIGGPK